MADFDPPFSSVGGVNRSPTTDEQADGFTCGAADLTLFNRLFGRIEAELKAIQDEGGITGSEADDTTVLQAIQAMISAATGGGDTSQYVLFSQAQARLPIYPEVTTNNGVVLVSAPATGTIRIPASATILHRGIRPYTTSQTDLPTDASKTYHLRWNPTDGFSLKDLASGTYNPGSLAETSGNFDSAYDDALIARIITNSSNVAAITNLINRDRLTNKQSIQGQNWRPAGGAYERMGDFSGTLNWARTPKTTAFSVARRYTPQSTTNGDSDLYIVAYGGSHTSPMLDTFPVNRYETKFSMLHDDWDTSIDVIYDASFGA